MKNQETYTAYRNSDTNCPDFKYRPEYLSEDMSEKMLTLGCEAALSGEMEKITVTQQPEKICLKTSFTEKHGKRPVQIRTMVYYDPKYGDLLRTRCDCRNFQSDGFTCRHVAAVLLSDIIRREGFHFLRNTETERILKENYHIDDPFQPGALRRTDASIAQFLRKAGESSALLNWSQVSGQGAVSSAEKLGISFYLTPITGGMLLELKAGFRRKYVIKKMDTFLIALEEGRSYPFGKEEIRINMDSVPDHCRQVIEELQETDQEFREGALPMQLYQSDSSVLNLRYMKLSGRWLDSCLEKMQHVEVFLNSQPIQIDLQRKGLTVQIESGIHGAVLSAGQVSSLVSTPRWIYCVDAQGIFRIPASSGLALESVLQPSSDGSGELFIQSKDLPAVSRSLLPALKECANVEIKGELPTEIVHEVPVLELYLDLPQDGMISCRPMAVYPEAGKSWCLFNTGEGLSVRNTQEEAKAARILGKLFQAYDSSTGTLILEYPDENALYLFLTETIPKLSEFAQLLISDRLKNIHVRPASHVSVGVDVESGLLSLSMSSESMSPAELAEVLSAYTRKRKYYRMKNGDFFVFNSEQEEDWDTLSEIYRAYGKKSPEAMKIPLFRAMYLDEVLNDKSGITLEEGSRYRTLLENMSTGEERRAVPESLSTILRSYQKDGFQWISTLKENGFGGILADEMGLGKTIQVLAFLLAEKQTGKSGEELRTLIVAPASLIFNWERETERFTPELSACVIAGTAQARKKMISKENPAEIWITSYDLLKRDAVLYEEIPFACQIIDEAQYIKNPTTQAAKAVKIINSPFRLALTGTPIENRLSELWSIFDYLMPGFLYSYSRFMKEYETPVVTFHDEAVMRRLRSMTHPFILRRLKKEVLTELPEKTEQTFTVKLSGEQRKLYNAHAQRLKMFLNKQSQEEFQKGKLEVLAELTKLRQLCCGPELLYDNFKGSNAKLEACMDLVSQALDGGHRILIFSQFTSMLDEICEKLKTTGVPYYRIDGSTPKEARIKMADSFGKTEEMVFCISLKAGGVGLNLTAADVVIHYDPWWNLAAQNQATDRAHRIGQENPVTVYQMIAADTIEEQIQKLQKAKYELASEVLTGEGIHSILFDKDDLLTLLT